MQMSGQGRPFGLNFNVLNVVRLGGYFYVGYVGVRLSAIIFLNQVTFPRNLRTYSKRLDQINDP